MATGIRGALGISELAAKEAKADEPRGVLIRLVLVVVVLLAVLAVLAGVVVAVR